MSYFIIYLAKINIAIAYRAINKLSCTINQIAESLHKQTGWAITIIAGGPMPRLGGANQSLV